MLHGFLFCSRECMYYTESNNSTRGSFTRNKKSWLNKTSRVLLQQESVIIIICDGSHFIKKMTHCLRQSAGRVYGNKIFPSIKKRRCAEAGDDDYFYTPPSKQNKKSVDAHLSPKIERARRLNLPYSSNISDLSPQSFCVNPNG